MGFRFGSIKHLGNARLVAELVGQYRRPICPMFIQVCILVCALNLSALYDEAYGQAMQLLEDAKRVPGRPSASIRPLNACDRTCWEWSP